MFWSSAEVQQRAWEAVDASGVVSNDAMLLGVLNRGANKLDQFLDLHATMTAEEVDEGVRVRVAVSLANKAPAGLPPYVEGSGTPEIGLAPGTYRGVVQLSVPGSAGYLRIVGGEPAVLGPDGESQVMGTEVTIDQGASTGVEFEFVLPEALHEVTMLASARIPTTAWSHDGDEWRDGGPRVVSLP